MQGRGALIHHGGPDALGIPLHDFSCNSHGLGPCPEALQAVQQANPCHYPDPHYDHLRHTLAAFCGVTPQRIVVGASGSELIQRLSFFTAQNHPTAQVHWPSHAYSDYARAAQLVGLAFTPQREQADLIWLCEPSSPLGQACSPSALIGLRPDQTAVLDCAYAPLRLEGQSSLAPLHEQLWQLHTPNKALGLTGVRGAWLIAPAHAQEQAQQLHHMAASWPVGAHGVAMLEAWTRPSVQSWLAHSLPALRQLKTAQTALCQSWGWQVLPSVAHFFAAVPALPTEALPAYLAHLRTHGIKLRECSSFGLPHTVRINTLPTHAQNAWAQAHLSFDPHV